MTADCVLFFGNTDRLGLLKQAGPFRLATELRDAGFSTQCIDIGPLGSRHHLPIYQRLINKFVGPNTLWLGISTTFMDHVLGIPIQRISAKEDIDSEHLYHNGFIDIVLDMCRQKSPNIKFIIGGGFYFNLHKYNFYHFRGYADREIVEFTKWCHNSSYSPKINRVGNIITCDKEYNKFSVSKIKWDPSDIINSRDVLPIEISRGCIFKCKFCSFPLNGKTKGEWVRNFDHLREELIYNYEMFGTTKYLFSDDTYNDSFDKISMLHTEVFDKLDFKIEFTTYLRLDLMIRNKGSAQILADSGLKSAMFGIETNNDRSARSMGKGVDFNDQIEYLHSVKSGCFSDTLIHSGFVLGFPHDTKQSLDQLRTFLMSDNNPLDNWYTRGLSINPQPVSWQKEYFSEIDLNYQKYGYQMVDDPDPHPRIVKWINTNTDLTWDYVDKLSVQMRAEAPTWPRYKLAGFDYPRNCAIIDSDVLRTNTINQIKSRYDVNQLVSKWITNYYDKLFLL